MNNHAPYHHACRFKALISDVETTLTGVAEQVSRVVYQVTDYKDPLDGPQTITFTIKDDTRNIVHDAIQTWKDSTSLGITIEYHGDHHIVTRKMKFDDVTLKAVKYSNLDYTANFTSGIWVTFEYKKLTKVE